MIELLIVAQLLDCHPTPEGLDFPIAWRMVEGRKCWYTGPRKTRIESLRWKSPGPPIRDDTLHPQLRPEAAPQEETPIRQPVLPPVDEEFENRWRALENK